MKVVKVVCEDVLPGSVNSGMGTHTYMGDGLLQALRFWSDPKEIPARRGAQGATPLQVFRGGKEISLLEFQEGLISEIKEEFDQCRKARFFPSFHWSEVSHSLGVVKDDIKGTREYFLLHPFLYKMIPSESLQGELIPFLEEIRDYFRGEWFARRGMDGISFKVEKAIQEIKEDIRRRNGRFRVLLYSYGEKEVKVEVR